MPAIPGEWPRPSFWIARAHIFRQLRITWSQVSAAASGYLLMGFAWKGLCETLHRVFPAETFCGLGEATQEGDLLYFSFVTMTTLGYGDIVPVSLAARRFVVVQAVIGQLFLVVLIARLVGMVGGRNEPRSAEGRVSRPDRDRSGEIHPAGRSTRVVRVSRKWERPRNASS